MNLCRSCGSNFSSVAVWDRHRVGQYSPGDYKGERRDWSPELGRRCLEDWELHGLGLELNERGAWHDPIRTAQAATAFRATPETASKEAA